VVQKDPTASLYLGAYGQALRKVGIEAHTLTAPSWGGYPDEVWTVRDGTEVIRVPVKGAPQVVSAPQLSSLGKVSVLRLSRDGARVLVIAKGGPSAGPASAGLYVGLVVRTESALSIEGFLPIAPSLISLDDANWYDSTTIWASGRRVGDTRGTPFAIRIDGSDLQSQAIGGLPGDPVGLAAVVGRPALASAQGSIWRLGESTWVTLVRGKPVFTGTAPFYPG
jgi:hypothetical protein